MTLNSFLAQKIKRQTIFKPSTQIKPPKVNKRSYRTFLDAEGQNQNLSQSLNEFGEGTPVHEQSSVSSKRFKM
jgi:hypothetical protein